LKKNINEIDYNNNNRNKLTFNNLHKPLKDLTICEGK